ncbi:putative UPF0481 protein At3g02645 isoform X2 [Lycium barbarum]|uniref:putative UPF0481 protein At3g02645 isoform X2 n=1 Tax=Lycium barbarum TaxID=112863 RepID=UPI00293F44A9|nr:putative UPF0481 protein At3g02645 isoform X2 [Lycium barbarum]
MFILSLSLYIYAWMVQLILSPLLTHTHTSQMSQADAINSSAAEVPDWSQSVIDIPGPPLGTPLHEESDKIQRISPTLLENTSEEDHVKYYRPHVVSIGPIHHGRPYVKPMEDFKRKAVRELAERVKDEVSIGQVCASVEEKLLSARNCYSCDIIESFQEDREWCKMMFLDSCFVVAFIYDQNPLVTIFGRSLLNMKNDDSNLVRIDLLLYENQLPFAVLDALADAFRCKESLDGGLERMSLEMPFMLTASSIPGPTFDYIESCLCIKFRRWKKKFDQFLDREYQWEEAARASGHLLQYYLDLLIFFLEKKKDGHDDKEDDDEDDDERNLLDIFVGTGGAPRPPSTVTELKKVAQNIDPPGSHRT